MPDLILLAPLQGWVAPLDEAPDPVFSGRLMGDGLAIDPTGSTLVAPCAGRVISVHHTRHAVTLAAEGGAELLIHIGLETVGLGGEGFEVHVRDGQTVAPGDPLISFDIDLLAQRARSLLTPIIVTNGDGFSIVERTQDREIEIGQPLMILRAAASATNAESAPPAEAALVRHLIVPLAHGLHARPAARLAALAQSFEADLAVIAHDRRSNAKSPVSILTLGVRLHDPITLSAQGPDAAAALDALAALIESGMGELAPKGPAPVHTEPEPPIEAPMPDGPLVELRGVKAAPGLAIGIAARLVTPEIAVDPTGRGVPAETAALEAALVQVGQRLSAQAETAPRSHRAILGAHLAFLEDPELTGQARQRVQDGASAGQAWRDAVGGYVAALRGVGDARLAERVDDLLDLERQVLVAITGEPERAAILPRGAILLADDLLPSQLIGLEPGQLAGICTARGGPTSHVAILAAAMGLPALVAAGPGVTAISDGTPLVLDADSGLLRIAPGQAELEQTQAALAARRARREAAQAAAHADCATADGVRIEVFANLGSEADAHAAVAAGAEGCGLLRTEFLFMERSQAPSEDEQAASYQAIATALAGRPLILRTLDIGGDKPVDYLPIPPEENPALGLRGLRVGFWKPELLRAQLRAVLRVEPRGQCRIMLPMVASLDELRRVRAILDEERLALGVAEPVQLGIMVETPAAAISADLLAAEADFLSIGTNDLAQYTLAMDRGNPLLAAQVDSLHPAVLRLIGKAAEGGARYGRLVGVCGGLASDLAAVPILIGLGVTELSATPSAIPEVKALVRSLTLAACRELAERALAQASPAAVRALAPAGGN
ncbi:phosphoenolpyruvate--protein phosphotransferase [Phenylobacterium montanum]|uniref:phosphoenolpyruvate--protein phosphotransferase n=1 Tax=Phenylobacterium montanum TaxID=2823693 RepID=A0A975FZZ1_9CAUL|nr:phosphoenolpyruvate--protein phosphotransferase [Caulobacter sp. S6]QUD88565.1 phosphoenolpyruvate--protein phosphotransferase [Caulobacter sp. S6]